MNGKKCPLSSPLGGPLTRYITDIMAFCFVVGTKVKSTFHVEGQAGMSISKLREVIYEKNKNDFKNFDANKLNLWKVDIPGDAENDKFVKLRTLENRSDNEDTIIQELEGQELTPFDDFGDIFAYSDLKNIRIIVQPPVTTDKCLTSRTRNLRLSHSFIRSEKRKPDDSDEENESKSSKKMKLKDISRKIMMDIKKLDGHPAVYSNPQNFLSLPFPYPGSKKPIDRFSINEDGFFTFMGRKEFSNVLDKINEFKANTGYMEMFIYGTVGYGKSHILTAIACFLLRSGRRVVYLPDCRKLAVSPVNYIKSALFLTYVDDDAKISEINACENFDQIIEFCESLDKTLYFIVDQTNALDDCSNTGINLEKKIQVKENLDKMCADHFYIKSSSANNQSVLHLRQKQTNEKKIELYGGFDKEEMEEWWKKHNSVLPTMNNQQKDQIEDITGNIPLFLNILLESDCKNFEDVLGYLNQQLTSKIQESMTNFSDTIPEGRQEFHVDLMSSFLTKGYPPSGYGVNDFDHRFFYVENGFCHYVCGTARDCMANYLYEKGKMEVFTDIKWISCIEKFKNNPSVKEFFVEKACIASIFKNGIMANGVNFKPDDMEFFYDEKQIRFSSNEGKCMLYLPRCWNQEAIDGLLISQTNNKLYVAPVQITLDKSSHSDFEGKFFSSIWPNLNPNLSGELEIIFIWITSESNTDVPVESKSRKTRNKSHEINPDYIKIVMGFGNVNRNIDRYLS
ncbi:5414_t:CDS:2 [Paraglomus brasilianum]|uniref:5414_t:CDS:1 n=1 Tax=Paraglomus brasilianum TaxID=144538 RepID=A0A9N9BAK0_9GLOM|nr:5414_t:CDS:2 [Paraglomus brasilianum]